MVKLEGSLNWHLFESRKDYGIFKKVCLWKKYLSAGEIVKIIHIPDKILNLVIK